MRAASLIATAADWQGATHAGTVVAGMPAQLQLDWSEADPAPSVGAAPCPARGLAVDRLCRIYRLTATSVQRLLVGDTAGGLDYARLPEPVTIVGAQPPTATSTTAPRSAERAALQDAVGIAVDADDRLFLADRGTRQIAILDLWHRRLLRVVPVGGGAARHQEREPAGLGCRGRVVFAVVRRPVGLLRLSATRGPVELALPTAVAELPADAEPSRVAVLPDGSPVLLWHGTDGASWLLSAGRPALPVGPASDIAVDTEGAVVIAPCPAPDGRATLRRVLPTATGWVRARPLDATDNDGSGLVVTTDGRLGYWTEDGFRLAVVAPVAYATEGTCVTARLDSGTPRNRWGRLLLEACIPDGTSVLVGMATSDDDVSAPPAAAPPLRPLHRRPDPVTPWWPVAEPGGTYEAPVAAPPGRYLWVTLRLQGNQRRTPRVRELRVEHHEHVLVRRLPGVYAADPEQADFLSRYLALFDGLLHDLDVRSRFRDVLVDPAGTPLQALDWLASFVGLALDERWAPAARRRLVAEVVPLYRRRGTAATLARWIAIYLAGDRADQPADTWVRPIIVEHYRLRHLHAAYAEHAHRFSVLVPQPLSAEQEAVVRHVLDTERPAHTTVELCTVDAGMRLGRGVHLGLSSVVGPTGALRAAVADQGHLGHGLLLGGPSTGIAVESGRVAVSTRVG